MRIVGALSIVAVAVAAVACQDLTQIGPERVPPPERNRVQEGTLDDPTDPCGALDVGEPQRLSATSGDSDGVRMTLLPRPGVESWVGVAWLEHAADGSRAEVAFQTLLEDGIRLGDAQRYPAGDPDSVDIVARPTASTFLVVAGDSLVGSTLRLLTPLDTFVEPPAIELPNVDAPKVVLGLERGFVAGLEGTGDGPRPVLLLELTFAEDGVRVDGSRLAGLETTDVAIASSGAETWLAWEDPDGLGVWAAALTTNASGEWEVAENGRNVLSGFERGALRQAHGTANLAFAFANYEEAWVYRFDANQWLFVAGGSDHVGYGGTLPLTRGEAGARWAIVRAFDPGNGDPAEVHLDRARHNGAFCASPGECARVTTDRRQSSDPEILAVEDGYLVAWSDRLEDGQTDVFVTLAKCRATTRPTDESR